MGKNKNRETNTDDLLMSVCSADTFQEVLSHHTPGQDPSFSMAVYEMMDQKGISAKEMIRLTGMERSYFYHILSGARHPGRNMVLRIGFCLGASLPEMNRLLKLAGFSELYPKRRRDAVLIYAVTHSCTMEEADKLLLQAEEEPLFVRQA